MSFVALWMLALTAPQASPADRSDPEERPRTHSRVREFSGFDGRPTPTYVVKLTFSGQIPALGGGGGGIPTGWAKITNVSTNNEYTITAV